MNTWGWLSPFGVGESDAPSGNYSQLVVVHASIFGLIEGICPSVRPSVRVVPDIQTTLSRAEKLGAHDVQCYAG